MASNPILEILEFLRVYVEDKLIFNAHFRQILQSQYPQSPEGTHELIAFCLPCCFTALLPPAVPRRAWLCRHR